MVTVTPQAVDTTPLWWALALVVAYGLVWAVIVLVRYVHQLRAAKVEAGWVAALNVAPHAPAPVFDDVASRLGDPWAGVADRG